MVLNYVDIIFYAAMFLITAVNNLKVNAQESKTRAKVKEIVQNISRVNNLLESFIKHVEQAEGTADVSDQSAEAVSDVKDIIGEYHSRKHESNKSTDSINLDFRASAKNFQVKTDVMENVRDDLSDIRYGRRENRRVNIGSDDDTKIVLTNVLNKNKTSTSLESNLDGKKEIAVTDLPQKNENKSHTHFEVKTKDEQKVIFTDSPKKNKTQASLDVHIPITNGKAHSSETPKVNRHSQNNSQTQEYHKRASTSQEDNITQEKIAQLKILRQEMKEACRVVVKRKCYKAIERVTRDICSRPEIKECSEKMKKDLEKNGIAGCDKEFNNEISLYCKMGYDYPELDGTIFDINYDELTQRRSSRLVEFEIKCRKSNYKKARNACKYAVRVTCEKHGCTNMFGSWRKVFEKSCKLRCSDGYRYDTSDSVDTVSDSVTWQDGRHKDKNHQS